MSKNVLFEKKDFLVKIHCFSISAYVLNQTKVFITGFTPLH